MANIYVRSTDGNNADNGSTWALAKATLGGAAAIDAAGDNIYLSSAHNEAASAGATLAFAGTLASPVKVISVNDGAAPPTATLAGAIVSTTGANTIIITGSCFISKVHFKPGVDGGNLNGAYVLISNTNAFHSIHLKDCEITYNSTNANGFLYHGASSSNNSTGLLTLENVTVKFGATAGKYYQSNGRLVVRGGGLHASGPAITLVLALVVGNHKASAHFDGVDLSSAATAADLVSQVSGGSHVIFRNCKLPASWSGNLVKAGDMQPGAVVEMHNCDSGNTNYRLWVECYGGTVKSETTLVRTGGASDGTTGLSWKLTSNANASLVVPVCTPEIHIWNETTGSSKTVTLEILHDSAAALKDDEIWIEASYFDNTGNPKTTGISDFKTEFLATGADQTSSSETWTTTGMANPNKQKLAVTFTPQQKGYIRARVCMAKASYTAYVDPKLTVA